MTESWEWLSNHRPGDDSMLLRKHVKANLYAPKSLCKLFVSHSWTPPLTPLFAMIVDLSIWIDLQISNNSISQTRKCSYKKHETYLSTSHSRKHEKDWLTTSFFWVVSCQLPNRENIEFFVGHATCTDMLKLRYRRSSIDQTTISIYEVHGSIYHPKKRAISDGSIWYQYVDKLIVVQGQGFWLLNRRFW